MYNLPSNSSERLLDHHIRRYRFIGLVGLMVFSVLLCGCASSRRRESIPEVKQPDRAAEIYFIRNKAVVGSAISYELVFDGINFFSISVGKYTMITADPGEHLVGVRMWGGWSPTWKEDRKEVNFKANQKYYFIVKNALKFAGSRRDSVVIEPLSACEGEAIIKESSYVAN